MKGLLRRFTGYVTNYVALFAINFKKYCLWEQNTGQKRPKFPRKGRIRPLAVNTGPTRSSAKELILAFSKPKTAKSSTESNKISLASNQGPKEPEKEVSNNSPKTNNDWISYLKNKQQNASKNSPCATPSIFNPI